MNRIFFLAFLKNFPDGKNFPGSNATLLLRFFLSLVKPPGVNDCESVAQGVNDCESVAPGVNNCESVDSGVNDCESVAPGVPVHDAGEGWQGRCVGHHRVV